MPLSVEELLRPRIKCMIRYPDSPFPVGAILEQDIEEPNIYHYRDSQNRHWTLEDPQLYPEVFKEMQWWEDRKVDEMPEYVKYRPKGTFHKIDVRSSDFWMIDGRIKKQFANYLPATLSDYHAYINHE